MMENLFTVGKVFSDRIFRVPDYQRGYAWEEQQCQDFLEDLELLSKNQEHFLGLLILHKHTNDKGKMVDHHGHAYSIYDVVDGQQRLTTLVLLMNAIRLEMKQQEEQQDLAAGIKATFIIMRDLNNQTTPKLSLNRDTNEFFLTSILEQGKSIQGPTIRSHHLLIHARNHFTAYLAEKRVSLGEGYPEWLKDQYFKISQQLTLVVYTVDSEAGAGVVFETMNNRGKALTELEKVKNYLLYLASKLELPAEHALAKSINDTWTHIFERLMAAGLSSVDNEDQLLRAHWLMAYDYDRQKWEGSRSIKDHFDLRNYRDRHIQLLADLQDYLDGLRNTAVAYCDILNPTHPNAFGGLQVNADIRSRLVVAGERLVRLSAPATFYPLLIATRIRFPKDGQIYLEALELCEKFAFRVYRLLERGSYTGQTRMFRLGHQLYHGRDVHFGLDQLRKYCLEYCPDSRFGKRIIEPGVDWYGWRGLVYFLYEYEYYLAHKAGTDVRMKWEMATRKKQTVEHILPQTPDADGYWNERFDRDKHRQYVHDIGNLTLTFDNSVLSNKPFPQKKGEPAQNGCYAGSKLYIEQAIAAYDDWTAAEIESRHQMLSEWASERWKVDEPATVEPPGQPRPFTNEYIQALAERDGIKDIYLALIQTAKKLGLGLHPHKRCMVLTPPKNRNRALITVWIRAGRLWVGVWASEFPKFSDISKERVREVMGPERYRFLDRPDVTDFSARVEELFRDVGWKKL